MARTRFQSSNIGAMCAIPLLFTLLAFAAVHYVARSAIASAERQEIETEQARMRAEKEAAEALRKQAEVLLRQISVMKAEIERLQELIDEFETNGRVLEELRNRLEQYRAEVERLRSALAELQHRLAVAEKEARELHEAQKELKDALRSADELKKKEERLRKETKDLEEKIRGVLREGVKVIRPPGGSRREALLVECDGHGAKIMPQNIRLGVEAGIRDQEVFLGGAKAKGLVFFYIRPDGFASFEVYRRILESYNETASKSERIDRGYEPIDADWKLMYLTE